MQMISRKAVLACWIVGFLGSVAPWVQGAYEAERHISEFKAQSSAWAEDGALERGVWNIREGELRMQVRDATPFLRKNVPTGQDQVASLQFVFAEAGPASRIEVVAGGGNALEGEPATQCRISQPFGIAFDPDDNMFICEETHRLLRVDAKTGILTVVTDARKAGAPLGDGGPVAQAAFAAPHNLVADAHGNLFIADTYHYAVRRVDARTGLVSSFAGNGSKELRGDGGPATAAGLDGIACLSFARDNSALYLGGFSKSIRKVDMRTGIISTVAGIGGSRALTMDSKGNLFTAAGAGLRVLGSDGNVRVLTDSKAQPPLKGVKHLWSDAQDNILIADAGNHLIRKFIVSEGKLLTVAGTGIQGMAGVPGLALEAQLSEPHGVTTHPRTGDIYIADSRNHRVLKIRLSLPRATDIGGQARTR